MKHIKDFRLFENRIYIDNSELDAFLIPEEIKKEIMNWDIITKSPYGESFYSSDKINWGYKPEGSFRVSDHWNFTSKGSGRIHCVTDKEVHNNKEVCLGQYKNGIYKILMCYPKPGKPKDKFDRDKKVFNNDFYMNQRKEFKNKVKSRDITAEFDYYGDKKKGLVTKYTGSEIGLDTLDTNLNRRNGEIKKVINLKLYDKGKEIKNIFDRDYIRKFENFK